MNIQDLRDIVAQINAAYPTDASEFPLLLEGKEGWLIVTFMAPDGIKIRLKHWCDYDEDWMAIASFYELSEIAWDLSKRYSDNVPVSIVPGSLALTHEGEKKPMGSTLDWLQDIHLQALCLFIYLYPFSTSRGWDLWDKVIWKAQEQLEALELLFFDEDEFEVYHECGINGYDWHHMQSAALIARQNTALSKARHPVLCGINVSAVNNNLELSAMCPTATTHHLAWYEDSFLNNFSFTIPVELIDAINQSIDVSVIETVLFQVNPELIRATVRHQKQAVEMGSIEFLVVPIKGRYWYPKVPINQITEKSVIVSKDLLKQALSSATKTSGDYSNEVLLQVQDEQLFVHGRTSSFQIDAADCAGVKDNEIRLCAVRLLDMLKHIPGDISLFLDFPDKVTQAFMLGTCHGIQYLVFGLVKGDRVFSTDLDIAQKLLTIPGIIPGEPDLVVELVEQPVLDPPMSEDAILDFKNELMQVYGLDNDWLFSAKIDELIEKFIDSREIIEGLSPSPEIKPLFDLVKDALDDNEYAIAQYESGDGDLYYHGGLSPEDLQTEIEAIESMIDSTNILAGRIKEISLKLEKTYSVRMTFA